MPDPWRLVPVGDPSFLLNRPIAVVTAIAVGVLLPGSRDPRPGRADLIGGVLVTMPGPATRRT
jgi:hypothetical protein